MTRDAVNVEAGHTATTSGSFTTGEASVAPLLVSAALFLVELRVLRVVLGTAAASSVVRLRWRHRLHQLKIRSEHRSCAPWVASSLGWRRDRMKQGDGTGG